MGVALIQFFKTSLKQSMAIYVIQDEEEDSVVSIYYIYIILTPMCFFANIWIIRCISVFVSVSFRLSSTQLCTPIWNKLSLHL